MSMRSGQGRCCTCRSLSRSALVRHQGRDCAGSPCLRATHEQKDQGRCTHAAASHALRHRHLIDKQFERAAAPSDEAADLGATGVENIAIAGERAQGLAPTAVDDTPLVVVELAEAVSRFEPPDDAVGAWQAACDQCSAGGRQRQRRAAQPRAEAPCDESGATPRDSLGRSLRDNARFADYAFASSLRDSLGRSLRDNARCAGYAFASSLRDSLGRSLRDNARCAGYAFASSLRDSLGRSLRDNARCAGYAFASSLRDSLGRSLRDNARCAGYAFASSLRDSLGRRQGCHGHPGPDQGLTARCRARRAWAASRLPGAAPPTLAC